MKSKKVFKQPQTKKADTVLIVEEKAELMKYLIEKLPTKSRFNIKTLLKERQIWVRGRAISQFNHELRVGDEVTVKWVKTFETKQFRGMRIIFEDDYLIVIDKQAGFLSIATEKNKLQNAYALLSTHVKEQDESNRIFVVHRLDRDTSGIMMFAKSEEMQQLLQETWHSNAKERTYLAVTEGSVYPEAKTIQSYLGETKALIVYSSPNPKHGQLAITHYETIERNEYFSMLKVNLETGRKNQIRVHMQSIGCPIVGDAKYGASYDPIGRVGLHAWILAFQHPITKEQLRFETGIPHKFRSLFAV
jgi:23S rRNA pseudouridine1911/1915/1917 synthase